MILDGAETHKKPEPFMLVLFVAALLVLNVQRYSKLKKPPIRRLFSGNYWIRTSDLLPVKQAL